MSTRPSIVVLLVLGFWIGAAAAPRMAESRERHAGVGFNLAVGPSGGRAWDTGGSGTASDQALYAQFAAFELRLFPVDEFSIDLQWNWLEQIIIAKTFDDSYVYMQDIHFHFHTSPDTPAGVALGPFLRVAAGKLGGEDFGMFGVGGRFGVDLQAPGKVFGHGIYFRPALLFASSDADIEGVGWEMVLEFTWIWYGFKS